jgi:hypothetical protein
MRTLVLIISAAILSGCNADWHLRKAIAKDPSILLEGRVIEYQTDTIEVVVPPLDTTITIVIKPDTLSATIEFQKFLNEGLTIENERQKTTAKFNPKTNTIDLESIVKEDSVSKDITIPKRTIKKPHTTPRTVIQPTVDDSLPWWWWVLFILAGLFAMRSLMK